MATSLLRLGRLCPFKYLQVERWGILRTHLVASYCTKTEEPAKPVKKTKAANKTAEATDERATLIAYKTAVAFPVRLSQPGVYLTQSLGVAEPVAAVAAAAVPLTAASDPVVSPVVEATAAEPKADASNKTPATDDTPLATSTLGNIVPSATASSEASDPAADGSSSSSSSDSDSDSDSDSEDEMPEVKTETKTSAPEPAESMVKEEVEVKEVPSEMKTDTNKDEKELSPKTRYTPASAAEDVQEAQVGVQVPSASCEELVNSAHVVCTATEDTSEVTRSKVSAESAVKLAPQVTEDAESPVVSDVQINISSATSAKPPADTPVVTTQPISAEDSSEAIEAAAAEAAAEVSAPVEIVEELVDCAPVVAETTDELLQAEAPVEPSDESAAAPPEPEEPFDNSTYKNYQHHSYTPYTFVDMDVKMAEFRLPQPSSGRHSPRH